MLPRARWKKAVIVDHTWAGRAIFHAKGKISRVAFQTSGGRRPGNGISVAVMERSPMKTWMVSLALAGSMVAVAQDVPTPLGHVKEGVYFGANPRATIVFQFNAGQFNLWTLTSNSLTGASLATQSGTYRTNGGTLQMVTPSPSGAGRTNEMTFMKYKGETALWSTAALHRWQQTKTVAPVGVYSYTDKKPEDVLGVK
jgi:hypothetical protein